MILDVLLVVAGGLVIYRGYRRGFLRSAINLVAVVLGAYVAFRSSETVGEFVRSWTNLDPLVARGMAGLVVFTCFAVAGAVVSSQLVKVLGPLRLVDRLAGAAAAGVLFIVSAALVLLAASAFSFNATLDGMLAESRAAQLVADEGAAAKSLISRVAGNRVLESLINLNQLLEDRSVVLQTNDTRPIPGTEQDDLFVDTPAAQELFELTNLARIEQGLRTLAWSSALARVAAGHGQEMYVDGYFSHVSPVTGTVADRLQEVGIPFGLVGENLALAPTVEVVHQGLLESPSHRDTMLDERFTRVGMSVIEGPLGLMSVQVFTG